MQLLNRKKIILDQNLRKQLIVKQIDKVCRTRKLKKKLNEKLLDEVVDLVEKPNVLVGKFNMSFLDIPKEILITSMQQHQKYFPLFNQKDNLTNGNTWLLRLNPYNITWLCWRCLNQWGERSNVNL